MVPLVPQGQQARLGRTAPQVRLVPQVHRDHKEILDLQDQQVQAVPQVALVLQDQMVLADLLVPLAQQEALDPLDPQVQQVQQERKYLMVVVTLLVQQDQMATSISTLEITKSLVLKQVVTGVQERH